MSEQSPPLAVIQQKDIRIVEFMNNKILDEANIAEIGGSRTPRCGRRLRWTVRACSRISPWAGRMPAQWSNGVMDTADRTSSHLVLRGSLVELQPMQAAHAPLLLQAAADGELWTSKVTVIPGPQTIDRYVATALEGREAGTVMPFAVVQHATGRVVGSTRFWKIDRANRKLEIGHTWLSRSVQRSGVASG